MVDPLFQSELALELGLTISEMEHGRGTPMSIYELTVWWPAYFAYKARQDQRDLEKQGA